MIKLYQGRADTDSMKFLYDDLGARTSFAGIGGIVVVPDQYTLAAEKKVFKTLQAKGLMSIEIMSFSRLASKLASEDSSKKYLDDLGRSMLIRKVVSANRENLKVFFSVSGKNEFIRMISRTIQEFKEHKITPDSLKELIEKHAETFPAAMLLKKLKDVAVIYEAYEEELSGRYFDTEDYLNHLCEKIRDAQIFENNIVWVHGFEFFSKRLLSVIEEIAKKAPEINISLFHDTSECRDYALFEPVTETIRELTEIGERTGKQVIIEKVPESYRHKKTPELQHLEKNLYAFPIEPYKDNVQNIKIIACGNIETEIMEAASEIRRLTEQNEYRFKDIAVITNDTGKRKDELKRVFREQGIAFFDDGRTSAVHNRFMQIVLNLCRLGCGYSLNEIIFGLLKAGIKGISVDEAEILENYVLKYGITERQWKKPFYKIDDFKLSPDASKEQLDEINQIRLKVVGLLDAYKKALKKCNTGKEYGTGFYEFLRTNLALEDVMREEESRLKEKGELDFGAITAQLWEKLKSIIDQLSEIIGDSPCSNEEFAELLRTGIEALEVGRIPTTIDQVLIGDFNKTPVEGIKAMFVLGFNDGLVPLNQSGGEILSDYEKDKLNSLGQLVCTSSRQRREKEKIEIYKTLSAPQDKLYITYTLKDEGGDEIRPSNLLLRLKAIYPQLSICTFSGKKDSHSEEVIYRSREQYFRDHPEKENRIEFMRAGRLYTNKPESLNEKDFNGIYGENLVQSPSSIESFSHCPFAHFMRYGIKADERKVFELSAPEMGSIFHEALMRFSEKMTKEKMWSLADEERCEKIIDAFAEEIAAEFKKGQLFEGEIGEYRISRIKSICRKTAFMVADHVNRGSFDEFYFETAFGRKHELPPIEVELENGRTVFIEGRIDRIDLTNKNGETYVKIIDYKSGNDKVVKEEILSGYKLQLLLYMMAAVNGLEKKCEKVQPAGVFYFKIQEPSVDGSNNDISDNEKFADFLEKSFKKAFKMDGIVVNDVNIIDAFEEDFSGFSDIIKVRKLKDGTVKGSGDFTAMNREEFKKLMDNMRGKTEELCKSFAKGNISISPMKINDDAKACAYCKYKTICGFDVQIPGFEFNM